jgi:hypothetical protein
MEKYFLLLLERQDHMNRLFENQNRLLDTLIAQMDKTDKESLQKRLLDNTDLKDILKIADTKFFKVKKLFKTYRLDQKDYYLIDEVLDTIREHRQD